jgi:hypothetical protein
MLDSVSKLQKTIILSKSWYSQSETLSFNMMNVCEPMMPKGEVLNPHFFPAPC